MVASTRAALLGLLLLGITFPGEPYPARAVESAQVAPGETDDRWGINHAYADAASQRRARDLGARWNRWEFRWEDIEPTRGQFRYGPYDRAIDNSIASGLTPQGILLGTPEWARDPQTQFPRGLNLSWNDPGNLWGRFVRETAARYAGRVRYWEVWNEPDFSEIFWPGTVADYYQALKIAYLSIKSVDPSAQVIMGGLSYWPNPGFLEELLQQMRADPIGRANNYFFDILAWHTYSRPSDTFDRVTTSRGQLARTIGNRPIWVNETGVSAWDESPINNYRPYLWSATTREQAAYMVQVFAYAVAAGADKVFVYRLQDTPWPEAFGLVRVDGTVRPAYAAYQVASRYLSHAGPSRIATQGDMEQVIVRRGGERLSVVWNRTPRAFTGRVGALATSASVVDQGGGTRAIRAVGGQYQIELGPATANNGTDPNDYYIGGPPFIVVETVPTGLQTLEEGSPLIGYAGAWEPVVTPGPSGGAVRRNGTAGFGLAVEFDGPIITWMTAMGPDRGIARVEIDGALQGEIDLYNPTTLWEMPLTFGELSGGSHRMTITILPRRNLAATASFVDVDAFLAAAFRPAPPPPTPTPVPTPTAAATPTATPAPTPRVTPTPTATPRPLRAQAAAYSAMSSPASRVVLPIVMRARNGWTTPIALQNRGDAATSVVLTFLDESGAVVGSHTLVLPAQGAQVVEPGTVPALRDGYVGSAVVESAQPLAASVREARDEFDALGYTGGAAGGSRAYAPLLFKDYRGWETGLQVQNLGDTPAPVAVTYQRSNGPGGPWFESAVVPPGSAVTFYQPANPELPGDFVGSAVVEAAPGASIVAIVNEVHQGGSGSSYEAAAAGSSTVTAPLVFKNFNGWNTGLQVQNVGIEETEIVVTYLATDGTGPWFDGAIIPAGGSATLYQPAHGDLPDGFVGAAVAVSTNAQPLVAIVNEVNSARNVAMTYGAFSGGSFTLSLPHLARGGDGWQSGVQVQNLGEDPTIVTLQLRGPDGALLAAASEVVGPGVSQTFYLPAIPGVPEGWRGAGVVESSPPQPLGAIINETRY